MAGFPVRPHPCRRAWHSGRVLGLALLMLGGVWAQQARAQVSSDVAAKRVAQEYGVDVLRVRAGDLDGTPVWLITVMTPGGNFNSAFQVTTLAVDRVSGALVPAFRQGVNGATGTGTNVGTRMELRPDAARSGTWR